MTAACSFYSKWRFSVEIDGVPPIAPIQFEKISTIGFEVAVEEMWHGGRLIPEKYPGRGSVDNVTFERGSTSDLSEIDWFRQVADFASGNSNQCSVFKREIKVIQNDGSGKEAQRIILYQAWPRRIEFGEFDNSSDEKVMRKMEVAYDYPEIKNASGLALPVP